MKTIISKILATMAIAVSLGACNFLNTEPLTQVPASTYYADEPTILSGLAGCYYGLYLISNDGDRDLIWFPGVTDDGYTDNASWQMFLNNSLNNNMTGDLNTMYAAAYDAIFKCNNFIKMVTPTNVIAQEKKNQYINEAKVLRAYYYFFLTNIFGDAVLALQAETKREEILKYTRTSRLIIRDSMLVDLHRAIEQLPKKSYSDGHIVSGTAAALAMRYLIMDYGQPDYAGIISLFEKNFSVDNDPHFGMVTARQFKSMFDANTSVRLANQDPLSPSDNKEVMFSIRYSKTNANIAFKYPSGITNANNSPRPSLVDFFRFDDGTPFSTANPKYDPSDPFRNRDARLHATVINPNSIDTVVYMPKENYLKDNPTGYAWKKSTPLYILYDRALSPTELMEQDIVLIRYPEVLLMYAEALNESGRSDDALKAVNKVRQRFLPILVDNSQAELRNAIRYERRAEFAQEGFIRYMDMQRLGLMGSVMPTLPISVKQQNQFCTFTARQRYWPIPEFERISNPNISQNDHY